MIQTTIADWRRRVNEMCCACVDRNSLEPLYSFLKWSQSVGYDPPSALPPTEHGRWGAVHKMILESIDLKERWAASSEWLLSHGFTTQNIWDKEAAMRRVLKQALAAAMHESEKEALKQAIHIVISTMDPYRFKGSENMTGPEKAAGFDYAKRVIALALRDTVHQAMQAAREKE